MKVGLVLYGSLDTVSGGYLYDRMLVAYLRSHGDDVAVLSVPAGHYLPHLLDNFSVRLPAGFDIIVEDELAHPSLLAANRARAAKGSSATPVVSLVHNLRSSERRAAWQNTVYRQIERGHLESVDGYIFNSAVTERSVAGLLSNRKPCVVAAPGGDRLGSLGLDALHQRLARAGPLRLVFLANIVPMKGLHILMEALRRAPPGLCELDVAGSPDVNPSYAARMRLQGASCGQPVRFHGVIDGEPLADLLSRADLLVIPSYYEGFGIAYLEGMAFGLPAIGTTAGAIPQVISDGVNGFTIESGNAVALQGLIQKLAADRQWLSRLSLNARAFFDSCPTWEESGGRIRDFLLQMLRLNPSSHVDDARQR